MRTSLRVVLVQLVIAIAAGTAGAQNAAPQPSAVGDWQGTLSVGGATLRLAVHVRKNADGTMAGSLDSLDQGAMGLPIPIVTVKGDVVRLEMTTPPAAFEGKLSADGNEMNGTWTQSGTSFPLVLKRGPAAAPKRPQEPVKPYPYNEEDVTYANKAAGITLAGTLTLPRGATRVPAAILISGSGAEDRNEAVFGHKPFLVWADYLTRNGIAVLRVDDRGIGGSTGKVDDSTSEDFAADVIAGVEYLKTRKEIDPKRIGLIGHSEGGLIAPLAAVKSRDVAFIVLMAGPGLPGKQILYLQGSAIAKASGVPEAQVEANRRIQERIFTILETEKDPAAIKARLAELKTELLTAAPESQRQAASAVLDAQFSRVATPWFRYFIAYDPRPTLARVSCPVLAIAGELDLQVPYAENLSAIDAAVKAGGNQKVTTVHLPGLNHLFQIAKTGSPAEYSQIEETIAPAALKLMSDWILQLK